MPRINKNNDQSLVITHNSVSHEFHKWRGRTGDEPVELLGAAAAPKPVSWLARESMGWEPNCPSTACERGPCPKCGSFDDCELRW